MAWTKYPLIFKLLSPMHIGFRKVGNLMQTRGYVPGKTIWAALTSRLTRDSGKAAMSQDYVAVGNLVNTHFRFSYLYPAMVNSTGMSQISTDDLTIHYPWSDELFEYRFFDSYASTAVNAEQQTAANELLHEVEYIRPISRPLQTGQIHSSVYLAGALYVKEKELPEVLAGWRTALERIQLGGERGYGWGRVRLAYLPNQGSDENPIVSITHGQPILAHTLSELSGINGSVEPLVGWERNNTNTPQHWRLSKATVCYMPGAIVNVDTSFTIGTYGIWE